MLPFALPIMVIAAIAIVAETRGSPVFVQIRTGHHGRRFRMVKLRTMIKDADHLKATLAAQNQRTGPDFKIDFDPRITKVGRLLRKTSVDELPQLFNVLVGSMSLVGPRPTSFGPETYSLWHAMRLEAKPGLTGQWQIHGRDIENFDERVRLEIHYLRDASLKEDLSLILKTVPAMLTAAGR
jgi:lipopolysaccharide/colanic/teichoic acid biosynthesis glycosyltransferase